MINDIELRNIIIQLEERIRYEANQLYRLAWRMERHGCAKENIAKCREEARFLDGCSYYAMKAIINPFTNFVYAFKNNRIPWKCRNNMDF